MHSGSRVQIHSFKAFFLVWEFLKEKSYIEKIENSFIKVGAFFSLQYIRAVKNQNNPFDKEIRQFLKYLKVNMYKVYKLLGIKAVIFIFLAIMSITFTSRLLNVLKFK